MPAYSRTHCPYLLKRQHTVIGTAPGYQLDRFQTSSLWLSLLSPRHLWFLFAPGLVFPNLSVEGLNWIVHGGSAVRMTYEAVVCLEIQYIFVFVFIVFFIIIVLLYIFFFFN